MPRLVLTLRMIRGDLWIFACEQYPTMWANRLGVPTEHCGALPDKIATDFASLPQFVGAWSTRRRCRSMDGQLIKSGFVQRCDEGIVVIRWLQNVYHLTRFFRSSINVAHSVRFTLD